MNEFKHTLSVLLRMVRNYAPMTGITRKHVLTALVVIVAEASLLAVAYPRPDDEAIMMVIFYHSVACFIHVSILMIAKAWGALKVLADDFERANPDE